MGVRIVRIGSGSLFRNFCMIRMPVLIMDGVLDMFAACPARRAEKGEEHQPLAVEARQQRREHADRKGDLGGIAAIGEGSLDDCVLGIEACKAK